MKKEIEIFTIHTESISDEQHILINGVRNDLCKNKFQELRNFMWEQEQLLDKIERINIEAKKLVLFEKAKSIYSIEKIEELLKL